LVQATIDGSKPSVFLTLQKDYGGKDKKYSKTFAVQQCGGEPYEIALRFAGCCLRCGPCFASSYAWVDKFLNNTRVVCGKTVSDLVRDYKKIPHPQGYRSYNWLRIVGGEPLLNDKYIEFLFDAIIEISRIDSQKFNDGVVIQTNGIFIGQGNVNVLRRKLEELFDANPKVKVCIEISIKGTNEEEFELITRSANRTSHELSKFTNLFGWNLSAYSRRELFKFNIEAYYKLKDLALSFPNFRPTVIAGFGVNESFLLKEGESQERISIMFKDNKPIYHPQFWSNDFKELYRNFTETAAKNLDTKFCKMPMYGIKDLFEYPWVGPTLKQGKQIYGDRWYDAKFAHEKGGRNLALEESFKDILDRFFLVDNKTYYSTLIK